MAPWTCVAVSIATLVALAACAPPAPPSTSSTPTVAPVRPRAVASPTPSRPYSVGLSVPDASLEPWRSLIHGARDEATRSGIELVVPQGRAESPPERQAQEIRELTSRPVDFILLGAGEGPVVAPAIEEALARNLPIGGLSSLISVEQVVFKLGPDHYAFGRVQAECLGAALGGRGAVGLLAGPPDSIPDLDEAQGFRETLRKQFPRVQLVAERAAHLDRQTAGEEVTDWLGHWPSLAGLAAEAEPLALGALDGLAASGRLGRTKVAAANLGPLGESSVRDSGIACAAAEQAVAEGRAAVRNALAYLNSQPYQRNVKIPPVLLTPGNFDEVDWDTVRVKGEG